MEAPVRYLVLACDYDGTLATSGRVDEASIDALERLLASGRRLILVTGRELADLHEVFPHIDLFDYVVAENGALLYRPATGEEHVLGEAPPAPFVNALQARGVAPLSVGRSIVATWEPHEAIVLETIRELGLELQVIFNKGAVMVLPAGVNKGTGLSAALDELGVSPHNVVGIGDAENDHGFLRLCECAVAVGNALPMLQERADVVTVGTHGRGVEEIVDKLVDDDFGEAEALLSRHHVLLGTAQEDHELRIPPFGSDLLVAGPSASGKSTAAIGVLARLAEQGYQFCLIDPEGDYETFDHVIALGDATHAPSVDEILGLLRLPSQNAVVRLLGLAPADRPAFVAGLLPRLQELRAQTGHPHWIALDEAHQLLPASRARTLQLLPEELGSLMLITVHPDHVASPALNAVDLVVAIGESPEATIRTFCTAIGQPAPTMEPQALEPGEAIAWRPRTRIAPVRIRVEPSEVERLRHRRKYAEGELPPEQSFHFRGPENKLNLRAQNLTLFNQLAEGIDDATWLHHLRRGDYSRWFREEIKDEDLAEAAAAIEAHARLSPRESRAQIAAAIQERYAPPA
jgi:hydroxymethylpyrimidine pyrophosphatase-like HAD family hydrolase